MPLFINNELLKQGNPNYNWVTEELAKIKKRGEPIHIKTTQKQIYSEPTDKNPNGRPYPMPNTMEPLVAVKINKDGYDEIWRFSRGIPNKDSQGNYNWQGENGLGVMIREGELILNPKKQGEAELAFFFLNVSNTLSRGEFKLIDLIKEAEDEGKILGEQSALNYFLFNGSSPLNKSEEGEEKLRYIASSWGVQNAERLAIPILKKRLKDAVDASEKNKKHTGRGISDFIYEATNDAEETEYKALHQRAIDKNVYGFNLQQNAWCFKNAETGVFNDYIVGVLPTQIDYKDSVMIDHLKSTEKTYLLVKSAVEGYDLNSDTRYSHMKNWPQFKSFCAKRGLDVKDKKRAELEKELIDQDKSK